jgi:hypothetical protein
MTGTDALTLAQGKKWAVTFSLVEGVHPKQPLIEVTVTEWGEGRETVWLPMDQAKQLREWLGEREYPAFDDPQNALVDALEKAIESIDSETLVNATNRELASQIAASESMAPFAELPVTFDLMWNADMRAIKAWQDAHPETEGMVWPDRANHVMWLMDQLDAAKAGSVAGLHEAVDALIELGALRATDDDGDCLYCGRARGHRPDCEYGKFRAALATPPATAEQAVIDVQSLATALATTVGSKGHHSVLHPASCNVCMDNARAIHAALAEKKP